MVDNNQINTDAEYRPKEEEYVDVSHPLGVPRQQVAGRLKRLLIVVAIIVAVFLAYNFFNWYSGGKPSVQNKKQPLVVTQPQVVISDNANLMKNDLNDSVHKQLDVLSQEAESNREQLAELSNSLIQGQKSIENLNKNISLLAVSLREIDKKIQQISAKEIKPVVKKVIKSNVIKKKISIYHVKAIVPERAWLESEEGNTVSVRVGDTLEGYGSVQAISPKQGIVVTSSKVIQYGNNDF